MSGISVRGRNPIALPKSYFSVVLLITLLWYCLLCWVVVTFQSVDEMLWCDYSNESYWAVLSCGSGYYALQGDSNLLSLRVKSYGVTIEMKATEQYFPVVLFIMLYKVVLTFESVDEILWCGHSNESYWTVLSQSTIYCKVFCRMKFNFFSVLFTILYLHFRLWLCSLPVTGLSWNLPFWVIGLVIYNEVDWVNN